MKKIDIKEIFRRLPHRYPFLLVDRIIDFEEGKKITGMKNVTFNEPFFPGHFPENPVMPGVLILEAMAQTGGVLLLGSVPDRDKKLIYLIGVDKARFRKPVVPGDQLRMEVSVTKTKGNFCQLWAEAYVENEKVAEAEFLSTMVEKG
ncbi:MAG: 3-hydroxyacyl-ACP dehydratase FabZ [Candidatus Aminicenantia bacterium]